jgi:hypothetical protein
LSCAMHRAGRLRDENPVALESARARAWRGRAGWPRGLGQPARIYPPLLGRTLHPPRAALISLAPPLLHDLGSDLAHRATVSR